jgi:hypothetical protein
MCIPFLGAAAGKPLQIGLMRRDEIERGIDVYDAAGERRGTSAAAGRAAVGMTIATRIIYLAPMLWMPVVQRAIERAVPLLGRSRPASIAAYTLHAAANSAFVTPLCIALFDQRASLQDTALEPGFRGLLDAHGARVERLYFNKGL